MPCHCHQNCAGKLRTYSQGAAWRSTRTSIPQTTQPSVRSAWSSHDGPLPCGGAAFTEREQQNRAPLLWTSPQSLSFSIRVCLSSARPALGKHSRGACWAGQSLSYAYIMAQYPMTYPHGEKLPGRCSSPSLKARMKAQRTHWPEHFVSTIFSMVMAGEVRRCSIGAPAQHVASPGPTRCGSCGVRRVSAPSRPRSGGSPVRRLAAARVLHLELAHKALSHSFSSVQGLAETAATKAIQRFAQARDDAVEPRHMPDDQEHQHVKNLKATEDIHERCGDVAAFLARSDVVPRVTQACRVLDCFVVVKRALHARAGEKWRRRC